MLWGGSLSTLSLDASVTRLYPCITPQVLSRSGHRDVCSGTRLHETGT